MNLYRNRSNIKWLTVAIIIAIYVFIYIGIGTSTVSEIQNVLRSGFLDGVTLNADNMYEIGDTVYKTFPNYKHSVALGDTNQFNYALDGFSYVDTLGIGYKTFVFDYSWYNGQVFDARSIVQYIDNNYWLMVFRMVTHSNQLVTSIILFTGVIFLNYWLYPIITHAVTSMFGFMMALRSVIAKDSNEVNVRVYEARLLRRTAESYENSRFVYWLTGFIALVVSLYTFRYQEETAVFVAVWVNIIVTLVYIIHKIVVIHIQIAKEHKEKIETNRGEEG